MSARRVTTLLMLAVASFVLAACITIGNKFDPDQIDQLSPSTSTIQDAQSLLGPASSESTLENGAKLLQWIYSRGSLAGGSGAHVAILFDPSGKMVRITHRSAEH